MNFLSFRFLLALSLAVFILAACTQSEAPALSVSELTVDEEFLAEAQASETLAEQWFLGNFRDKGIFVYEYNPLTDEYSLQNNMIRQLMASRLLAEMSQENTDLQKQHQQNLDFIFRYWYQETEDELGYIDYSNKSKLGANAMALRTLVFSPFYAEYEQEAERLADGILSLLDEDGAFEPWFIEPSYEYDADYLLTFYSGEAILSLVEYGLLPGKEEYLQAAKKAQDYYLQKYVVEMKENYYPAYVPWHSLALNKLFFATGDQKYADAIFTLNDKLLELQDTTRQIGRFYNPKTPQYGTPHVASDGVYTEGLAYALEVALQVGDQSHAQKYLDALQLSLKNLQRLQYTPQNTPENFDREKVLGGFFSRTSRRTIRIDNVQHTLDAYRKIQDIWNKPSVDEK